MSEEVRILVIEDEAALSRSMRRFLEQEGYTVSVADTGSSARRLARRSEFDLILLDLKMPDEDGLSLLKLFQTTIGVPVIIVSGKAKAVDRILGLELGADDYISKPFNLRELQARIKAVLRSAASDPQASTTRQGELKVSKLVRFADWELDLGNRELRAPDGSQVVLTAGEFKLLEAFVNHPSRVLSRDQLLDWASNRDWTPFDRSIDTQIQRLRKKIEQDPRHPDLIRTVRGAGYMFTPKVQVRESIGP
jgi:two-component system OmpR family response regulator